MSNIYQKSIFRTSSIDRSKFAYCHKSLSPKFSFWYKFVIFLILIILLVSTAILASIFIFGRSSKGIGERLVEIDFSGKDKVNSLESNNYAISLINKEISDLKAAELRINFPAGFFLDNTSQPCAEKLISGCTWTLGKVKRGESKTINFTGYFLVPSKSDNDFRSFSGVLDFQLEDFSSHFQREFKKDIFVKPILSVSLEAEKKVSVGQKKHWQISLENLSEQIVNYPKIILEAPANFIFIPSKFPTEGVNFEIEDSRANWLIDYLDPISKRQIYFDGYFRQFSEKPLEFKIKAGLVNSNGQFFVQNEILESINLERASLNFSLSTINNQSTFYWGEEIPFYLNYQNTFRQIEDLSFKIEIPNSQFIDWQNLSNLGWRWLSGQNQIQDNSWLIESKGESRAIIWNQSQIAALTKILVGDSGEIYFNLKTISPMPNINNREMILKIKATGKYPESNEEFEIEGPTLTIEIKNQI